MEEHGLGQGGSTGYSEAATRRKKHENSAFHFSKIYFLLVVSLLLAPRIFLLTG